MLDPNLPPNGADCVDSGIQYTVSWWEEPHGANGGGVFCLNSRCSVFQDALALAVMVDSRTHRALPSLSKSIWATSHVGEVRAPFK